MTSPNQYEIVALIAGITNPSEISLNKGKNDNIEVGDLVEYVRVENVIDPITNEDLGSVKYILCNFKIDWVAEKFSIARVTDFYDDRADLFTVKINFGAGGRLKTVTTDEEKRKGGVVLVKIGDPVTVVKPIPIPMVSQTTNRAPTPVPKRPRKNP